MKLKKENGKTILVLEENDPSTLKFMESRINVGREIHGQNLSADKMFCVETSCIGLIPRPKSGANPVRASIKKKDPPTLKFITTMFDFGGSLYDVTDFEVESEDKDYVTIDGMLYRQDMKTLIAVPPAREGVIVIPEGVKYVSTEAFLWSKASKVVFPKSIKMLASDVFKDCRNLEEIVIQEGPETIGSSFCRNCPKLETVTIPGSVQVIGDSAFYEIPLRNLKFADSDKPLFIDSNSFSGCKSECLEFPNRIVRMTTVNFWYIRTIRVPNTKIGLSHIPYILGAIISCVYSKTSETVSEYEHDPERRGAIKILIGDEVLYFPKIMQTTERRDMVEKVNKICFGRLMTVDERMEILEKWYGKTYLPGSIERTVKKLRKVSLETYSKSLADSEKEVALSIYLDMLKEEQNVRKPVWRHKRKYKKQEKEQVYEYLKTNAYRIIIALMLKRQNNDRLKRFLDLQIADEEALKEALKDIQNETRCDVDLTVAKAYLLEAIGKSGGGYKDMRDEKTDGRDDVDEAFLI